MYEQSPTLQKTKMIVMKALVEIELITTSRKKNYIDAAPETVQLCLKMGIFVLHALSIFCLTAHVYKFFHSKTKQHMVIKNLTLHCFLMLMLYLWIPSETLLVQHLKITSENLFSLVTIYLLLAPLFLKFIIAIDLCLCFRKPTLNPRSSQSTKNKKFIIYCIITAGVPLGQLFVAYLIGGLECAQDLHDATKSIIRFTRLVPICAAFWYIRRSSFNKKEFYKKYSLHIRLLVLIGAIPSVLMVIQLIFQPKLQHASDDYNIENLNAKDLILTIVIQVNFLVEGIVVGICFTFRKGSFQSATNRRHQVQENCSRKTSEDQTQSTDDIELNGS